MDNKVTKKRITDHLEYDWYKYLIFIIVGIVAIVFTFKQINRNKNDEDFAIFFTAYSARENTYVGDMFGAFDSEDYDEETYGPNIFREMTIEFQNPDANEYGTLFSTHGQITSDVVIVRKSYFEDRGEDGKGAGTYRSAFGYLELNDEILKLLGIDDRTNSQYEFMCVNDKGERVSPSEQGSRIFGVRIDNLSKIGGIAQLEVKPAEGQEAPESEFFLYILRDGANIGEYGNKKNKPENKQTFFCVRKFLEKYGPALDVAD